MLLVDHAQTKTLEGHALLEDGMRADKTVDFPGRDCAQDVLALRFGHPSGQRSNSHPERSKQLLKDTSRLLRENLSGTKDGALVSGHFGSIRCISGHRRLS
jgi:hypothetical protein